MTIEAETALDRFIRGLPKAELHLHIEGSLEPEMVFYLAKKHGIRLKYASVDELRAAYNFNDLQSFHILEMSKGPQQFPDDKPITGVADDPAKLGLPGLIKPELC